MIDISQLNIDSDIIIKIENDIDTYDLISLVFLLYSDISAAMQQIIVLQRIERNMSLLEPWLLQAKSRQSWKHEFLQALTVLQLYAVIRKLGLHLPTVKHQYHPDNALYINLTKIKLYYLCENMTSENLQILKDIILSTFNVDLTEYETCELIMLKLMDVKFIAIEENENCKYDIDKLVFIVEKIKGMRQCADILRELQVKNMKDNIISDVSRFDIEHCLGLSLHTPHIENEMKNKKKFTFSQIVSTGFEASDQSDSFLQSSSEASEDEQLLDSVQSTKTGTLEIETLDLIIKTNQTVNAQFSKELNTKQGDNARISSEVGGDNAIIYNEIAGVNCRNKLRKSNESNQLILNVTQQRDSANSTIQSTPECNSNFTASSNCVSVSLGDIDAALKLEQLDLNRKELTKIGDSIIKSQSNINSQAVFQNITNHHKQNSKNFFVTDFKEDFDNLEDSIKKAFTKHLKPDKMSLEVKEVESEVYPIKDPNRIGFCVIINQQDFKPIGDFSFESRDGSYKDVKLLDTTMRALKFETLKLKNLDHDTMMQSIRHVIRTKVKNDDSVFMLCILSHGFLGSVLASDSVGVKIDEIQNIIGEELHVRGIDIPKVVLVQACQILAADCPPRKFIWDTKANFLICWATSPELIAYRRLYKSSGCFSIYVEQFCEKLIMYAHTHHLIEILLKVNQGVAAICKGIRADQVSKFDVYMMKKLYLNIPANKINQC